MDDEIPDENNVYPVCVREEKTSKPRQFQQNVNTHVQAPHEQVVSQSPLRLFFSLRCHDMIETGEKVISFKAKTGIHLPAREGKMKDRGREGGREIDRAGGERSVKTWLMSTGEMCLLSTEQRLQGSD